MPKSLAYLGIDPGKRGGVAFVTADGAMTTLPREKFSEFDIFVCLETWAGVGATCRYRVKHAYVEQVASSPQMGVKSAFTFGQEYGTFLGMLTALRIPFTLVRPQVWQKGMGCMSKGDKNVTKRRAQQLWPEHTITHAVADAMLIAEFCRRQEGKHEPQD